MSNYTTVAKKPKGKEWEEVAMLDNYFGTHEYGVQFPDGEVYPEKSCEFKNANK